MIRRKNGKVILCEIEEYKEQKARFLARMEKLKKSGGQLSKAQPAEHRNADARQLFEK